MDEEFDALEGFFYVLENGILQLLEDVETYLHHLQVSSECTISASLYQKPKPEHHLLILFSLFCSQAGVFGN